MYGARLVRREHTPDRVIHTHADSLRIESATSSCTVLCQPLSVRMKATAAKCSTECSTSCSTGFIFNKKKEKKNPKFNEFARLFPLRAPVESLFAYIHTNSFASNLPPVYSVWLSFKLSCFNSNFHANSLSLLDDNMPTSKCLMKCVPVHRYWRENSKIEKCGYHIVDIAFCMPFGKAAFQKHAESVRNGFLSRENRSLRILT